jgi:hypothetical protein
MRFPATLGAPLQEQDVAFVDGRLDVPGGLRDLAEEPGERLADAVLASLDTCRGDEDSVVAVVGDDLLQVLGAQRLRVVVEDLLRASRRCHVPPPLPADAAGRRADLDRGEGSAQGVVLALGVGRGSPTKEAGAAA